MKKSAVLLVAAMVIFGSFQMANASYMSVNQRIYFTVYAYAYYAFIYDYTSPHQESVTPGFIGYDSYLTFIAQNPVPQTTHVAYLYDSGLGRYYEAMAVIDKYL
jgi:hypothetical protein